MCLKNKRKEEMFMTDKEKKLFASMVNSLDDLPDAKKGEFIGYAKCMADMKRKMKTKIAENPRITKTG